LTGKQELSGDSWVRVLRETVNNKINKAKKEYDAAIAKSGKEDQECGDVDVDSLCGWKYTIF
jgi:hypothetical protein